ncbi:aldose 1-epimerase [Pseudacidovorax intermedius]|uniref:Aldose 1-epimerase n=1 Tax=Pseudacidovorax intermedius TaxID=433924 RepID=A0A370FG47_9BURK|nr:aldose 1-epimerase [Pseudacidovorax intermedius]RDI22624.1 aldose 1-epimerase [Pseudacidovorax intermedius]
MNISAIAGSSAATADSIHGAGPGQLMPDAEGRHWLQHAGQRLAVVPTRGGAVAAWQWLPPQGAPLDLWRPWDGSDDLYRQASFAMVPWSNRIAQGGFEVAGRFHAMHPNREGEPYPIHGDGWLQPWQLRQTGPGEIEMTLHSGGFGGSPYRFSARQGLRLREGGLDQWVEVRHEGAEPLPYGLGLHPWFMRAADTRIHAAVKGVWLSGADPIPTGRSAVLPPDWNLPAGMPAHGSFIDNAFHGWDGVATVRWPSWGLQVQLRQIEPAVQGDGHCLVYRPPHGEAFCLEPITHPIDAFHLPGQEGLRLLERGGSMRLSVAWNVLPDGV